MSWNWGNAGGGAASGAAAGSAFGPWGAGIGGVAGGVLGGLSGDDPEIDPEYQRRARVYEDRLARGGYDQGTADRYYNAGAYDINDAAQRSSRASGQSYDRRRLGASGMAVAAQNDVAARAAVQKRLARESAITRATGDYRQQGLDALGALGTGYGMNMDAYNAARQDQSDEYAGMAQIAQLAMMMGRDPYGSPRGMGYPPGPPYETNEVDV